MAKAIPFTYQTLPAEDGIGTGVFVSTADASYNEVIASIRVDFLHHGKQKVFALEFDYSTGASSNGSSIIYFTTQPDAYNWMANQLSNGKHGPL